MKLSADDERHVTAAAGWLELGNHVEASNELADIAPASCGHPEVLKLRWRIYNAAGKHDSAMHVADGLTRMIPDDCEPFVWRSYSARRVECCGVEHALQLLLDVVNDFPDEPIVPFNLACYSSVLGRLDEAKKWLHRAFDAAKQNGTTRHWKALALDEKDLEALRADGGLA